MPISFTHKDRVHCIQASMFRYHTLENRASCGENYKLNKPTDKWNMAKEKSHNNKTPISQIPQTHHLFLVKYCDGSSEANVL